jgi:hypothetical protein
METKNVTVYRYRELSEKAKERVYNDSLEMFNINSNDLIEETIKSSKRTCTYFVLRQSQNTQKRGVLRE